MSPLQRVADSMDAAGCPVVRLTISSEAALEIEEQLNTSPSTTMSYGTSAATEAMMANRSFFMRFRGVPVFVRDQAEYVLADTGPIVP